MKKVVLLSRVSTTYQDLCQQTEKLILYAKSLGYTENEFIIIEDQESAVCLTEEERNGLNKLKASIENENVGDVIVYELSRIARVPKILYSIRDFLINHNVQLHCLNPSFKLLKTDGTIDESANVIFSLFVSLSENEGFLRKERFKRGKEKMFKEYKHTGGLTPFGYTTDKEHNYIIKEDEAEIVRRIYRDYQTKSIRDISLDLMLEGLHNGNLNAISGLVRTVLRRPYYCGQETDFNGQVINQHTKKFPAIISYQLYKDTQDKMQERRKYSKTKCKHDYLCRGLLFTINNELLVPIYSHKTYSWIRYSGIQCNTLSISIESMDQIIWYYTMKMKQDKPNKDISKIRLNLTEQLSTVEKKLSSIVTKKSEAFDKIARIESRFISGKISEILADKLQEEIKTEIELLDRENQRLEADREALNTKLYNLSSDDVKFLRNDLNSLSVLEKSKIVKEEIERVIIAKTGQTQMSIGIEYKLGDYVLLDYKVYSKKLYDESGVEVNYRA